MSEAFSSEVKLNPLQTPGARICYALNKHGMLVYFVSEMFLENCRDDETRQFLHTLNDAKLISIWNAEADIANKEHEI